MLDALDLIGGDAEGDIGYGKLTGVTQLETLGELETPIILTNTLSVHEAAGALVSWTLDQAGNEGVRSVNAVAGETNDGYLNNIRRRKKYWPAWEARG